MTTAKNNSKRLLKQAMRPLNRPKHIALGVALGVLVGVVPKFSILPWVFGLFALLLPVNLLAFFLTAIAVSFFGVALDPYFHRLGYWLLTDAQTQTFWKELTQWRYFVWLQMNNTVVTGSTAAGLLALIPVYVFTRFITAITAPIMRRLAHHPVSRWLLSSPELAH